jgi:hypothetical protein
MHYRCGHEADVRVEAMVGSAKIGAAPCALCAIEPVPYPLKQHQQRLTILPGCTATYEFEPLSGSGHVVKMSGLVVETIAGLAAGASLLAYEMRVGYYLTGNGAKLPIAGLESFDPMIVRPGEVFSVRLENIDALPVTLDMMPLGFTGADAWGPP